MPGLHLHVHCELGQLQGASVVGRQHVRPHASAHSMVTGNISSLPRLLNTCCVKLSLSAALSAHASHMGCPLSIRCSSSLTAIHGRSFPGPRAAAAAGQPPPPKAAVDLLPRHAEGANIASHGHAEVAATQFLLPSGPPSIFLYVKIYHRRPYGTRCRGLNPPHLLLTQEIQRIPVPVVVGYSLRDLRDLRARALPHATPACPAQWQLALCAQLLSRGWTRSTHAVFWATQNPLPVKQIGRQ